MPIPQAQIEAAKAVQLAAAHDQHGRVRVIAGPGTGKSATIEERVAWLLSQGVDASAIHAISFTRASARDLRERVHAYGVLHGQANAGNVRVTTLHSLALRTLRAAGVLNQLYPVDPAVLDEWEQRELFDAEFGNSFAITVRRSGEIRLEHEAYWSTGQWGPPNYFPPNPPVTAIERGQFGGFHIARTHVYSCVLPGELVREVVVRIQAGTLNLAGLLALEHLIVDEFQDLNPIDLAFVDSLANQGVQLFVAGDDDQSLYSFRYAMPEGIQQFVTKYPNCGQHTLNACFRTTSRILDAASALITSFPHPHRVPKNQVSLYAGSLPPTPGVMHRWRFGSGVAEARAIAESCRDLINAGMAPRDILILLSNQRVLLGPLLTELDAVNTPFEAPRSEPFVDSPAGRLVFAVIRIVGNSDDYVAHRVVLGLRQGTGVGTCNAIADAVIANNLNYTQVFYDPLPNGVFSARARTALNAARGICAQLQGWLGTDPLAQHALAIEAIVAGALGAQAAQEWQAYAATVPDGITLIELRDLMSAGTDEQQELLLEAVYQRLQLAVPAAGLLPARVRIMTMHGSKGLSAKVVFIPGLEDSILPGPRRIPYPGLVQEGARLLYVSLTRARAACVVSFAASRMASGQMLWQIASRYAAHLDGAFAPRNGGLVPAEVDDILGQIANL